MSAFVFALLGLSVLGILVDIINLQSIASVDFIFDIIVLLVVSTNIIKCLRELSIL